MAETDTSVDMPFQKLKALDMDAALAELANGTIARVIGARYGATGQAIRDYLRRHRPEQYAEAIKLQAETALEETVDEFRELKRDKLCIARARARGDFYLKLAGKISERYADKQQAASVTINIQGDVSFASDLAQRARVFDAETVAQTTSMQRTIDNNDHDA
jgi:hypothetical protein